MIYRQNDGVRWQLKPDFAPLLDALLKAPGQTVKESSVKQVTSHRIGEKTFYIKRYIHHAVRLRPLKFFFKATQARQEWELARQLEARNIPIVRHVALGERRTWSGVQESILVTEGFDGLPLIYVPGVDPATVLKFVENMHGLGVLQADLHPGNLLVRKEQFELRLVDLHGTVVKPHLTADERRNNLAILRGYLPIKVSPEVDRLSARLRQEALHERSRRCLRHNRDFGPRMAGGLKWRVRFELLNEEARQIMAAPDRLLAGATLLLKDGHSSTVAASPGFVLKRFNFRRVARLFKDLFRCSPALGSFRKAYHLELLGIATARPVAAADRRVCRVLLRSYFLMEKIPGAVSLQDRLKTGLAPDRALIEMLGELIGRLHNAGLSHRDLKATNIILDANKRPHLIDLDGLTYVRQISKARAVADLQRLARGVEQASGSTRKQRIHFLRVYCRTRRSLNIQARPEA